MPSNIQEPNLHTVTIIGCGYVGMAVASHLYQKPGYFVTATTTRFERVAEIEKVATRVVVIKGNDPDSVRSLVQNHDTILLSIAPISDRQVSPNIYEETYIPTANNLVAALTDTQEEKQLIYLSSCSVYGNKKGDLVDETASVTPTDEYAEIMSKTEQILLQANSKNIKICILRLGGIYGPSREFAKRLSRIAGKTMPGSGEHFVNWIHLDDIVSAVDFIRSNQCYGIYNLVDNTKLTLRDLCNQVCDRYNLEQVIWDSSQPSLRDNNVRVNNQKIKAAGYNLVHPDLLL